ncbi:MAG: restriction endonuclease subunit S [Eubacterium sp.]
MKHLLKLKDIASYSKGTQINGDDLANDAEYKYLNGGINPSGKWKEANCMANTVTISEGGNSCGYVNYMTEPFWCGAHCYYIYDTIKHTQYLYYALKSQQDRIMELRSGACMPNINKGDLGNFKFIIDDDSYERYTSVLCYAN